MERWASRDGPGRANQASLWGREWRVGQQGRLFLLLALLALGSWHAMRHARSQEGLSVGGSSPIVGEGWRGGGGSCPPMGETSINLVPPNRDVEQRNEKERVQLAAPQA